MESKLGFNIGKVKVDFEFGEVQGRGKLFTVVFFNGSCVKLFIH